MYPRWGDLLITFHFYPYFWNLVGEGNDIVTSLRIYAIHRINTGKKIISMTCILILAEGLS
jgi:hypothetical protein